MTRSKIALTENKLSILDPLDTGESGISCLTIIPTGFATGHMNGSIKVWKDVGIINQCMHICPIPANDSIVEIKRLRDGRFACSTSNKHFYLITLLSEKKLFSKKLNEMKA